MNKTLTLCCFLIGLVPSMLHALTTTVPTTGTAATLTYVSNASGWAITGCNTTASGSLNIPASIGGYPVTEIGFNAFQGCNLLTSVTIPNNAISIGESAFNSCTSLVVVTIPNSITSIGNNAFAICRSLSRITIPNNVTSIGNEAFRYCSSLISVTIPTSVTSIGHSVFQGCTSLTSVTIPNGITSINHSFFNGCISLVSITIPSNVTLIGSYAFRDCKSLTTMIIPNSVTLIENSAFSDCTSLASVTIPNSVTSLGSEAFSNCTSLTSVTIPASVTSIGHNAFMRCNSLASVTIPNSVTSIGDFAFGDCSALTKMAIPNRFIVALSRIGIPDALGSQLLMEATAAYVAANHPVSNQPLIDALAADDAFLAALAQRVAAQNASTYATKAELANFATQAQITDATLGGLATGINTVTSHPGSWSLFTTAQIQEMAIDDLLLTRQENGVFVLNYDIEQSDDLNNWTTYRTNAEPLMGLPTDKAFVRIRLKK